MRSLTGFSCDDAKFLQRPGACFHKGPVISPCGIGEKYESDSAESWFKEGNDFTNPCYLEAEDIRYTKCSAWAGRYNIELVM